MVHCKQLRRRPRELAGVPGTRGRARAAAVASDPGYMRPTSSSAAREMAPTEREAVRAKAVPRAPRATCSSPHRHTAQTSAPRRSLPHRPRLRARRQPMKPAQGAGVAGGSSLGGRHPSAHHLGSFGARHLFHGNAEKLCDEKGAIAGGKDRLSALPEQVIQLVLSFLSSRQAARTCVLATRWRTLWKSVPSLRFDARDEPCKCSHEPYCKCNKDLKCFINSFVRCHGPTPLHECEIIIHHHMETEEFRHDCHLWLRYAVSCKVRVLRFEILSGECLQLSAGTLIAQHLTRLILYGIEFAEDVLSCQSLEVLEMFECGINIGTAFPRSLQHLRIRYTKFSSDDSRSIISAPGLVTLELDHCSGWTPLFKCLPALVTAFINIAYMCLDSCPFDAICASEPCVNCSGPDDDDCVLLQGLSGAANLELRSHHSMIFNKDIRRRCPVFTKLKTLLLGDWCIHANFSGLVYFLQHSPVLERLTLDTSPEDFNFHIQVSEHYKPKEQFLVSEHLKQVTVGYEEGDGRIRRILKLLAYHGVPWELIHTEEQALDRCS